MPVLKNMGFDEWVEEMDKKITVGGHLYIIGKIIGRRGCVFWMVQRDNAIPKIFTKKSDIPYSYPNLKGKKY